MANPFDDIFDGASSPAPAPRSGNPFDDIFAPTAATAPEEEEERRRKPLGLLKWGTPLGWAAQALGRGDIPDEIERSVGAGLMDLAKVPMAGVEAYTESVRKGQELLLPKSMEEANTASARKLEGWLSTGQDKLSTAAAELDPYTAQGDVLGQILDEPLKAVPKHLARAAPGMGATIGATALGGPVVGAAVAGAQVGAPALLEGKEEGVGLARRALTAAPQTALSTAAEMIGVGRILKPVGGGGGLISRLADMLQTGVTEGFTEGLQSVNDLGWSAVRTGEVPEKAWRQVLAETILGAAGGVTARGTVTAMPVGVRADADSVVVATSDGEVTVPVSAIQGAESVDIGKSVPIPSDTVAELNGVIVPLVTLDRLRLGQTPGELTPGATLPAAGARPDAGLGGLRAGRKLGELTPESGAIATESSTESAAPPPTPTVVIDVGLGNTKPMPFSVVMGKLFSSQPKFAGLGWELGREVGEARSRKVYQHAAVMSDLDVAVKKLNRAIKGPDVEATFAAAFQEYKARADQTGIHVTTDEIMAYLSDGLEGQHKFEGITTDLRDAAIKLRELQDKTSGKLLDSGMLTDLQRQVIGTNWNEQADNAVAEQRQMYPDLSPSEEAAIRAEFSDKLTGMERYMRRVYAVDRIGKDKWTEFVQTVPEPLPGNPSQKDIWRWRNAMEWRQGQMPGETQAQSATYLMELIRKHGDFTTHLGAGVKIDTDIFKHRTEGLPRALEDLIGFERDPAVRAIDGIARASYNAHTAEWHTETKSILEKRGLLYAEPVNPAGDVQFPPNMGALSGSYAPAWVVDALAGAKANEAHAGPVWRAMVTGTSLVKEGKTVGGIVARVRNQGFYPFFYLAQGIPVDGMKHLPLAKALTNQHLFPGGRVEAGAAWVGKKYGLTPEQMNEIRGEAVARNVAESSAWLDIDSTTEFRSPAAIATGHRRAGDVPVPSVQLRKAGDALKAGRALARDTYQGVDSSGKMAAWLPTAIDYAQAMDLQYEANGELHPVATVADLMKLKPEDRSTVFDIAGDIIRSDAPTPSSAPHLIRWINKSPFLGSFFTWQYEFMRSTYVGTTKQIVAELNSPNPKIKTIGAKRLAGTLGVHAALGAAALIGKSVVGLDDEDMEAMHGMLPPYAKDSTLVPLRVEGTKFDVLNLGYSVPYDAATEVIRAVMANAGGGYGEGDGAIDAAIAGFETVLGSAIEQEILVGAIMQVMRNEYETGGPIFLKNATHETTLKKVGKFLLNELGPGFVLEGERLARATGILQNMTYSGFEFSLAQEALALLTGTRVFKADTVKRWRSYAGSFMEDRAAASASWRSEVRDQRRDVSDPNSLLQAKQDSDRAYKIAYDTFAKRTLAAKRMMVAGGYSEGRAEGEILLSARDWVPEYILRDIFAGTYTPPRRKER